jgi:tetratricopeptide (TPR) repeat protein
MTIALLYVPFIWSAWLACNGAQVVAPEEPGAAPAPVNANVASPAVVPLVVRLDPPVPRGDFIDDNGRARKNRWEIETIGVYTLLLEAGLMELHGVTAVVAGRPVSPGLTRPVGHYETQEWTARLTFGPDPDVLEVELELCAPGEKKRCRSTSASGTRENPELAVAKLLNFSSEVLERQPAPGAVAQWTQPVSQDPYAVLICGRSASAWYGLFPMEPGDEGTSAKDPVLKAVLIDPSMALAQWLLARRYALATNWEKAMPHFAAAREGRPLAPVLLADEAMAMEAERRAFAAADAWDALLDAVPRDPRFLLARVQTDLVAGRLDHARTELEKLLVDFPRDSGVASARVDLADKSGEEQGMDDLLAHWQQTDPAAVEPVRRRIQLRIRQTNYRAAWEMLPELRNRGANDLADNYEIPLGVALGEWQTAAQAAERASLPDVARRIRAREKLTANPSTTPELSGAEGAEGYVVLGWSALRQDRPKDALKYAEAAEKLRPWDLEAMALSREAFSKMGNPAAAQKVAYRIAAIEPPSPAVVLGVATK